VSDILEQILAVKREEISQLRSRYSRRALEDLAAAQTPPRGFARALRERAKSGAAVIAEIKKASPSRGVIRADTGSGPGAGFDPAWIARDYEQGGAACLSVLTDEKFFQGANEHLQQARAACSLPVIRKDFLCDELQIFQARAIGADCVLLIAAALPIEELVELHGWARGLGLDVLVEVHDRAELQQVLRAGLGSDFLLGINNRNLRTFQTRLETTLDLLPLLSPDTEVVTESGISTAADVQRLRAAGVHRFLVGESLMRQPSPGAALKTLLT
jgi:indole-3-glycerol phosphate synthase